MKLIFLDIDGVICCNLVGRLEEEKMLQLKRIVDATGAKIVLSTDWRRQMQLKRQVVMACKRHGMEVIGATPQRPMYTAVRPMEIVDWLNSFSGKDSVTAWVALDDRDLVNEMGGSSLVGHFVRTHPATGLSPRLADAAIQLLEGEAPPPSPSPQPLTSTTCTSSSSTSTSSTSTRPTRTPPRPSPPRRRTPGADGLAQGVDRLSLHPAAKFSVGSPIPAATQGSRIADRQPMPSPPRSLAASLSSGVIGAGTSPPRRQTKSRASSGFVVASTPSSPLNRGRGPVR
ncbi:hypothetical protein AB1Y20_012559 [Prymnesium parvum]|uniref:Uncharacterized protein n=1 Tax=Prymnesium parvum TaxID=97485 RepID=A0AB34IL06_PRYPA